MRMFFIKNTILCESYFSFLFIKGIFLFEHITTGYNKVYYEIKFHECTFCII